MHRIRRTVLLLLAALALTPGRGTVHAASPDAADAGEAPAAVAPGLRPAVLVTGASTGIGRRVTEHLASRGYVVFAGARKDADLQALAAIPNVEALRLDVTRPEEVAAAAERVRRSGRPLAGLVNNAGIAFAGSIIDSNEADFDALMQVNLYGVYRVTKAFAPLVAAAQGRIVNIGSISGILSSRDLAAYAASKHAIEGYSDSLAAELAPAGVAVAIVEPGNYDSEIFRSNAARSTSARVSPDRSRYKKPDEVAATVLRALSEPRPQRRYMIVPNAQEAEWTIRKAIEELVQLNEGQAYTYDRDTLVRMLDEALAGSRPRREPDAAAR